MLRRLGSVLLPLVLLGAACGSSSTERNGGDGSQADNLWIMVTDQAGLGDQGFNDLGHEGLQRAAREFGGEVQVLQSTEQAQYLPNLEQGAELDATLVVGMGFLLVDSIIQAATAHPDTNYALVDALATDSEGNLFEGGNLASVVFREQEGAFLAGVVAGKTTETNEIGFVGGIEVPSVVRWLSGFRAGVKAVNPSANVRITYAGSFEDPAKGEELANSLYDAGADIIFEVGGGSGLGVFEAAKARGPGVWVIGSDTCAKRDLAPDNWLTSATKDIPTAVFLSAESAAAGDFAGGVVSFGLKEDAAGICQENLSTFPQDVQALVQRFSGEIRDETLDVPETADEVDAFTPPSA